MVVVEVEAEAEVEEAVEEAVEVVFVEHSQRFSVVGLVNLNRLAPEGLEERSKEAPSRKLQSLALEPMVLTSLENFLPSTAVGAGAPVMAMDSTTGMIGVKWTVCCVEHPAIANGLTRGSTARITN